MAETGNLRVSKTATREILTKLDSKQLIEDSLHERLMDIVGKTIADGRRYMIRLHDTVITYYQNTQIVDLRRTVNVGLRYWRDCEVGEHTLDFDEWSTDPNINKLEINNVVFTRIPPDIMWKREK